MFCTTQSSGPVELPARRQAVQVVDERLGEVGAHLDDSDARLRFRVRDMEPGAARLVQPHVADPQIAEFGVAHAAVAEHANDERPPGVRGALDS
jgi:hypothetical protein